MGQDSSNCSISKQIDDPQSMSDILVNIKKSNFGTFGDWTGVGLISALGLSVAVSIIICAKSLISRGGVILAKICPLGKDGIKDTVESGWVFETCVDPW